MQIYDTLYLNNFDKDNLEHQEIVENIKTIISYILEQHQKCSLKTNQSEYNFHIKIPEKELYLIVYNSEFEKCCLLVLDYDSRKPIDLRLSSDFDINELKPIIKKEHLNDIKKQIDVRFKCMPNLLFLREKDLIKLRELSKTIEERTR